MGRVQRRSSPCSLRHIARFGESDNSTKEKENRNLVTQAPTMGVGARLERAVYSPEEISTSLDDFNLRPRAQLLGKT
jgi:hypothetical protein